MSIHNAKIIERRDTLYVKKKEYLMIRDFLGTLAIEKKNKAKVLTRLALQVAEGLLQQIDKVIPTS